MPLKIAYLVNQYPKVSHSFIRREIRGIETHGIAVDRFSIRSCAEELVDDADQKELKKTRFILGVGVAGLLAHLARCAIQRPGRWLQALRLAVKLGWSSEQGILLHLAYLAEACVLLQWLTDAEITHLHAHFGTNSTTVAMLCQALGGPSYSFTVHGPEEFDKVMAIGLPEKIDRAAFVVTISSFSRSQLYRWCNQEQWSKIHVVHCGVDEGFLQQSSSQSQSGQLQAGQSQAGQLQSHLPQSHLPQFACVGRLCEQKGQLLLIEAVQQLVQQGFQFKLVLVGDGPLRPQIEDLIAKYGLEEQVVITGWADTATVRQQILASRAMVLPSFAEGLPVVVMETLALRRPVISTYVAGIPELVEPGVCGWLVPSGSIESLTEAMRSALEAPIEQLAAMGEQGAQRVATRHNVRVEAGKLAALFRSTAGQHGIQLVVDRTAPEVVYSASSAD